MSSSLSIETIRAFMDIPRDPSRVNASQWHQLAPTIFIDRSDTFTETILENVKDFLQTYPYQTLKDTLVDIHAERDETILRDLRFMRRSLLIGRDAIKLCTPKYSTPEHFNELAGLTRVMGAVIDDIKQARPALGTDINRAIAFADTVQEVNRSVNFETVSMDEITPKATQFLMTDTLLANTDMSCDTPNEATYHRARRMFRSVVHLGIVSAIISPDQTKQQFAMDGIELNAQYGRQHTELLRMSR